MTSIVPNWPAPPRVRGLVTTRAAGDLKEAGARVRLRALIPAEPVWLRQVHGTAVADADLAARSGFAPEADAAVARAQRTVCAVLVADCMPVLLADDTGKTVGIAHAGWRGLCAGVIEAAVDAMAAAPERLLAWLGPGIGPQAYEVGDEVRAAFVARDAAAAEAFALARPGHWMLDLYAVARQRLARCGVKRVYGGGYCTYSEPERFFSYRRDRAAGRMAALLWIS